MRRERPTLFESASWCGGRPEGPDIPIPGNIWTDSRDVRSGDGFVALPGEHVDGHRFVGDALSNGARLVIGTLEGLAPWKDRIKEAGASCLAVENAEKALIEVAEAYLAEVAPREKVAVTGSVGKTTTRELIRSALDSAVRVHAARRSHNTLVGCALTVLGMPPDTEILVFEMGTNHPGEIAAIVDHFPPTIAIITAVAPVHLEGFGTLDGVLSAKLEIIPREGLRLLIFNADDDRLSRALESGSHPFRIAGVGFGKGSTLLLTEASEGMDGKLRLGVSYGGQSWTCQSSLTGIHHAHNLGFAIMVGLALNISPETLLKGVSTVAPLKGRGRWIREGKVHLLIDESYNANPSSVAAALNVLGSLRGPGKRWAILGGMKELGETSEEMHRKILEKTGFLDGLVLVGEEWKQIQENRDPYRVPSWWVEDAQAACLLLEQLIGKDDTVLVKGSRSYGLEVVVERLSRE